MNKLLSVLIGIIIVVAVSYAYLTDQPRYSFLRLGQAIRNHDQELFTKYADVDAIVDEWVQWSSQEAKRELEKQAAAPDNPIKEGFVELLMPTMRLKLKEEFKQKILRSIEGSKGNSLEPSLPLINIALLPIHSITKNNNTTAIEILHPISGEKIIFKLRHMPQRYWRLVSIQVPAIMKQLEAKPSATISKERVSVPPPVQTPDQVAQNALTRWEEKETALQLKKTPENSLAREKAINDTILYAEYYQSLHEKISRNLAGKTGKRDTGEFRIALVILADGSIKNATITQDSKTKNKYLVKTIMKAINDSAPFEPLPAELNAKELEFNIPVSFVTK